MTTDNREAIKALVAKWRDDHRDYPESKQDCADELEALLTTEPPAEGGDDALRMAARNALLAIDNLIAADLVPVGYSRYADDLRAALTAAVPAQPSDAAEAIALALWHRFAPDSVIEWEDESEKAIYRLAAQEVLGLASTPAAVGGDAVRVVGITPGMGRAEIEFPGNLPEWCDLRRSVVVRAAISAEQGDAR